VAIPLLNGVNSAQRLRKVLPEANVLGGSVYIISHIETPGIVKQEGGACKLTFGTDNSESAKNILTFLIFIKGKINAVLTDKYPKCFGQNSFSCAQSVP